MNACDGRRESCDLEQKIHWKLQTSIHGEKPKYIYGQNSLQNIRSVDIIAQHKHPQR